MGLPEWHRDAPTTPPTPAAAGTRAGRSQAALLHGDTPMTFGKGPWPNGRVATGAADDRQVANWQHTRLTRKTRPVAMKARSRRRR